MAKRGLPLSLVPTVLFGLVVAGNVVAAPPQELISLGTAGNFAVLGNTAVTNTGGTLVTGDLGVSPDTSITGFPPGIVDGNTHPGDVVAAEGQEDALEAYDDAAALPCDDDLTGDDLGSLTLTSGVYCFDTSAQLTGTVTLDALGDPNAYFIFQIGSTLTTAVSSAVQLDNEAQACNVFWQVGTAANLGSLTAFAGSILAQTTITMITGATLEGRAISLGAAVTMDTNEVTRSSCLPQGPTECTTTLTGGTYTDIVVPDGATCTLIGVIVEGGVTVGVGSTLITNSLTVIGGDVTSVGAASVELIDTDILGSIDISGTTGPVTIGSAGCLVDPVVGGDLLLRGNRGTVAVCMMSVGGDMILKSNRNRVGLFENIVTGNLIVRFNRGKALRIHDNTVGGYVLVSRNKLRRLLSIEGNAIVGDLRCSANTPDPLHTGNTVGGLRTGECADPE